MKIKPHHNYFDEKSFANPNLVLNRREFISSITKTVVSTSCISLGVPLYHGCSKIIETKKKSLISIVRSDTLWVDDKLDKEKIKKLLNQGIQNITGHPDFTKAWNSLFSPNDRVAIKVNCIGKSTGSTKPALSYTVAECLNNYVNIPSENIFIFDRYERELIGAGYTINRSNKGIKVLATHSYPFSPKTKSGDIKTSLTTIITKYCTALINLSLLKTHSGAGISLSFKNHYGSIPKEIVQDDTLGYHSKNFKNLVFLNSLPSIRDKTRLCIIDSLVGQYHRGPKGNPNYQWKYNGLIMGVDPVAVDTIGLNVINEKRQENNLNPLKIHYLKWAEEESLGTSNRKLIELIQEVV